MAKNVDAPEGMADWLARNIGTRMWVVARRSKKRIAEGYDLFLTQARFTALRNHFMEETAPVEIDQVSLHLTEVDPKLAQRRRDTFPGMAFWSGTGPDKTTCRTCRHWKSDGYLITSGLLRDSICGKYKSMMHGNDGARLPHYAQACKYFEAAIEDRPILNPKAK